jgi:hypothetical protein
MTEGNPSSAGWATFEARMRTRRFARCIERATAGLEAGTLEEVRDALDEARVLCPDAPEVAELDARISALPSPSATLLAFDTPRQEPPAGWLRVMGAMCVLLLLFGLFGFGLTHLYLTGPARTLLSSESGKTSPNGNTPIAPADKDTMASAAGTIGSPGPAVSDPTPNTQTGPFPAPAPTPTLPAAPPSTATMSPEVPARSAAPAATTAVARDQNQPRADQPGARATAANRAAESAGEDSRRDRPSPATTAAANAGGMASRLIIRRDPPPPAEAPSSAATPAATPPPPAPVATPPPPPAPATEIAEKRPAVDNAAPSAAPPVVPAANTATTGDAPVAAVRTGTGPSRTEEAAQIRTVLSRYETAYNKLDASAASSVWPNVDQAALDRAFKGLISQRVSLGLCDITVIGEIGGASCAGKARWEPRVGGGLQTADRHWTFNLRKGPDGGWHIEQIRVR